MARAVYQRFTLFLFLLALAGTECNGAALATSDHPQFPRSLESYNDSHISNIWEVLQNRVRQEPLNLWASLLFIGAVVHTFLTHRFLHWAHVVEVRHRKRLRTGERKEGGADQECVSARLLHFLGEVEAVFGIWVLPLFGLLTFRVGWQNAMHYLNDGVSYHEPLFVVVIMAIASTRPILALAEKGLSFVARLGGGGTGAWWMAILTLGPVLGSLITEPAAMTISALLLSRQFYERKPDARLAYATLGLLFVNISVGGVLTHFAAPPVLMVAAPWGWNTPYMFRHFGWIALIGIVLANTAYFMFFRRDLTRLQSQASLNPGETTGQTRNSIPFWVTAGHILFMSWTVLNAHHPALVIGGFLFFLAFFEVTSDYQSELQMRGPILVGFFLAGLVVHGGLQQWWIAPVLRRLQEVPLMIGAIGLTAFNDNAAITYLATLVPDLAERMKIAIVAGAVVGGGLTVIANAPNPAGLAILGRHFREGVSPAGLLLGALPATLILALCFLIFR